eukprot:TRINITY_DN5129_c0_g2_i2.p2 TRINITY_DN5129_c0_g2~~TRINITY_DN5129_c0_g2_i2.p2  ORF type:complete len:106 (+),score=36.23 TRINITY_DN5129_c0_g2_i2:791-1108(+)
MEAFKAMKQAGGAMQEIHGELNVDAVEDCMDDINEQMEIANEITEALTNPMGEMGMQDDEDLLAELDEVGTKFIGLKRMNEEFIVSRKKDKICLLISLTKMYTIV